MKSLDSFDGIKKNFKLLKSRAVLRNPIFVDEASKKKIETSIEKLKKEADPSYDNPPEFHSFSDMENVRLRAVNAMSGTSDSLGFRDIMLLAWNASSLDIVKRGGNYLPLTRAPFKLFAHPVNPVSKFWGLASLHKVSSEKIVTGLLVSYLDDYRNTSMTYKNLLFKLLKETRYCNNKTVNMYFNGNLILSEICSDKSKIDFSITFRLASMGFRYRTLSTMFFTDLWSIWMFRYADFVEEREKNLRELQESWFAKKCTENQFKVIVANVLEVVSLQNLDVTKTIFEKYILPSLLRFGKLEYVMRRDFWETKESLREIFYYELPDSLSAEKILKNAYSIIENLYGNVI